MPAISRKNESKLSASALRLILSYDSETGLFRWRERGHKRRVGAVVGTVRPDGRRVIKIGYTRYLASRLAWLYVYGEWPESLVDHIDRNYSNDAIANLRQATAQQNNWNRGVGKTKSLGLRNIYKHKKRFAVRFFRREKGVFSMLCGKTFVTLEEAIAARDAQLALIAGAFIPQSPDIRS